MSLSNENNKYSLSPTNMYKYNINNVNVDNCTNGRTILFICCCCNVAVHIFGISSVLIILLLNLRVI